MKCLKLGKKTFDLAMQLLANIDPDDSEKHDRVLLLIKQIPPLPEDSEATDFEGWLFTTEAQLFTIDNESGGFELLWLHRDSLVRPGSITTVLGLFRNGKYIDCVSRTSSSRATSGHTFRLADANGDGRLDALIEIAGLWEEASRSVVYDLTDSGFTLLSGE